MNRSMTSFIIAGACLSGAVLMVVVFFVMDVVPVEPPVSYAIMGAIAADVLIGAVFAVKGAMGR
jgi:hypothetical protein